MLLFLVVGMHDGCVGGVEYFRSEKQRGLFARPAAVASLWDSLHNLSVCVSSVFFVRQLFGNCSSYWCFEL